MVATPNVTGGTIAITDEDITGLEQELRGA